MPKFGDLEAAIMEVVWDAPDSQRVRDVADALRQQRNAAFTTVQTVMDILYRKGWLDREKRGRTHYYWAAHPQEEYTARLLGEALDTATDRGAAFSRLLDTLDPDEVDDLKRALDHAKRQGSPS